ncbi:MAG TPA: cupin domain-containing protein [Alteraurantiacibacter sp.]
MPKLDLDAIPQANTTGYPEPYNRDVTGRWHRRIAPAAGMTRMGASHVVLKPGAWSSQRHWHAEEDELLVMLSGEVVLVEEDGETVLRAGDICVWPAGVENGHHLQNRTDEDCSFVAVSAGDKAKDHGAYPDIDMLFTPAGYTRKDGTPYDDTKRST